jgi:hypothetical protein
LINFRLHLRLSFSPGSATGYYYLWTVSDSLATASDYALEITQGETDINYSGHFSLVGGTGSSSVATPTTLTGNVTNVINMTSSGTEVGTAASMGTGTAMSRNATFSSPTLSPTSSASSGPASASATATSTSASASGAESTTSQASHAGALNLANSAALLITVIAATFALL